MKKLFILAAALLALASCSKDPETVINDGSIYFTNALTTRATTVTTATSLQDDGFNVLGYANNLEIFGNVSAKYASDKNAWTVSPVKYWASNTNYNFFASYPASIKFTNLAETDNKTSATIANFVNDGSVDLVLAGRNVVTQVGEARTTAAQLVFKHALSRIRFNFVNAYTDNESVAVKIDVTNVALIGENKTGDVTITSTSNDESAESSSSKITWSNVKSNNASIDFAFDAEKTVGNYVNGTGLKIEEEADNTTDFKYIIPAMTSETDGVAYNLACKIVAYDENNNVIKEFDFTTEGKYIPLKVKKDGDTAYAEDNKIVHEAGKSYTYTMNIASTLNDIRFTVAVEDWIEEDGGEIDFPGDN